MYTKSPDCKLSDKGAEYNTKTAIKSLEITINKCSYCFKLLTSNLKYFHPHMAEFLDSIPIVEVSRYYLNIQYRTFYMNSQRKNVKLLTRKSKHLLNFSNIKLSMNLIQNRINLSRMGLAKQTLIL